MDNPIMKINVLDQPIKEFDINLKDLRKKWEKAAEDAPTLYQYLKDKYDKA
jgi:hypothetical protein